MEIEKLDALTNKVSEKKERPELTPAKGVSHARKKSLVQRFSETFFKTNMQDVKKFIFTDVIVPGILDLGYDMITKGAAMWFYGDSRVRNKNSNGGGTWTSYGKISIGGRQDDRPSKARRSSSRVEERTWDDKEDALYVESMMRELLQDYKKVYVAEYRSLAGLDVEPTDWNFGWTDLNECGVFQVRYNDENGIARRGYTVKLPKVEVLEK